MLIINSKFATVTASKDTYKSFDSSYNYQIIWYVANEVEKMIAFG